MYSICLIKIYEYVKIVYKDNKQDNENENYSS